jgi:hypothetical protein
MQGISPYHGTHTEPDHGVHRGRHFENRGEPGQELQGTRASGSSSTAVAAASRQSLDLTIVTADGDRVTLSSNSSVTAAYATYQGSTGQGSTVRATGQTSSSSFNLSLSVEGNLSQDELKDIAKALQAYSSALKDILAGNMEPAAAHAGQISKLDEIASFEASFTSEQAVSAQSTTVSGS